MSNIYYSNIFKSIDDGEKSFNLIKKSVTPYEIFVKNAIKSLQKKQNIKARWKKIGGEVVQLQLINNEKFYKVSPIYEIKINSQTFEKGEFKIKSEKNYFNDESEDLIFISTADLREEKIINPKFRTEHRKQIVKINLKDYSYITNSNTYKLTDSFNEIQINPLWLEKETIIIKYITQDDKILDFKKLENGNIKIYGLNKNLPICVNNEKIGFKLINEFDIKSLEKNYNLINVNGEYYIISNERPIFDHLDISEENPRFLFENFTYKTTSRKGETFKINSVDSYETMSLIINPIENLNEVILTYNNLDFILKKISKSDDNELYRIQLEELNDDNDDIIKSSPLEHFFEDGIEIYEKFGNQKRNLEIIPKSSKSSEFSFILKEKNSSFSNKITPVFPKGEFLELSLNTYQLEKQLEALNIFINKPLDEQKPLLNLFKPIKDIQWTNFEIKKLAEHKWIILKDNNRSGTENQRSFVEKAMSTTDFMLLEGPPGSGKTTAILELICQLIENNKRILLCGSTHVAIDNVLERLKEIPSFENVLPVRIGDTNRISDSVKEFQINNIVQSSNLDEQLILDSANLVCGTTLGILQHPNFKTTKEQKINILGNKIRDKSICPEFDYLIIDESSKTTFNEFLIPALFAKKWILVGDVKQLSPFTDREIIESNIRNLSIKNSTLNEKLQRMCFLIKELCLDHKKNGLKFLITVTNDEIPYLIKEINFRDFQNKKYLIIDNNLKNKELLTNENFIIKNSDEVKETALYFSDEYDGIFINNNSLKELEDYIPIEFLLIGTNELISLNFRQNFEKDNLDIYKYEDRNKRKITGLDIPNSINKYLGEKSWASEIAWRMVRNFELKSLNGKKADIATALLNDINKLLPLSVDRDEVNNALFILKQVTLPSILESLQRGIDKKEKYHTTTTLTEGFTKIRKGSANNRFVTLNYQHRMHPEISKIPRDLFYNNEALNDAIGLNRDWGYKRYSARSIWINHNKHKSPNGSFNSEEIKIIKDEIEFFRKWKINDSDDKIISIGVITFYRRQETELRKMLREYCSKHSTKSQNNKMSQFYLEKNGKKIIEIKLYTVDKFQGQEADLIFLSMVQTSKDGFMDNPNRLNVAITRAKYQMVYVGMKKYFSERSSSDELRKIAIKTKEFKKEI